jgi:hypothetical protein
LYNDKNRLDIIINNCDINLNILDSVINHLDIKANMLDNTINMSDMIKNILEIIAYRPFKMAEMPDF